MPTQLKGRFNETGHLALNSTRVQAVATTDLSIIQGQGDITVNPTTAGRGTLAWSQIGVNRNLTLATRNGNMTFTGSSGTTGVGSSKNVGLYVKGDMNLVANNVTLQAVFVNKVVRFSKRLSPVFLASSGARAVGLATLP